jgi:cytosine/adenosine deaminase-related metal-dependent hydrolase
MLPGLSLLLALGPLVDAASLFSGGTIIAWDESANSLNIIRNGSILVENDSISAVFSGSYNGTLPSNLTTIDATNDIISTGFIDTHRHSWQTAFKTLGSNTTLMQYFELFGSPSPASTEFTPEDVYIGQLVGLYEALNGGVTTIVDFPHCTWSAEHSRAALNATLESGVRTEWTYNFGDYANFTFDEQVELFQEFAEQAPFEAALVKLGISYDGFVSSPQNETRAILDLAT